MLAAVRADILNVFNQVNLGLPSVWSIARQTGGNLEHSSPHHRCWLGSVR